jgi:undecaprenyl diphosphate synthase
MNVAFNYGGRDEIVYAIQNMIRDGIPAEDVTEEMVGHYLFTTGVPDPELIIRTSGELRGSNFLLWQGAYSEWYFTPTYWPDFDKEQLRLALEEYSHRRRRYGKVAESQEDITRHVG